MAMIHLLLEASFLEKKKMSMVIMENTTSASTALGFLSAALHTFINLFIFCFTLHGRSIHAGIITKVYW